MKKISVCVICYNQEEYILECLSSIFNQKGNFLLEVVIRDDCSSDKTREICESYIKNITDDKITIKLLDSRVNLGANKNSLEVLKNCTGDFVAFCEGDDYWTSEYKLQKQLNLANENPKINLFVHLAYFHYPNGELIKKDWPLLTHKTLSQSKILSANWQFAPTSSYFIRSPVLSFLPDWYDNATIGDIYLEIYSARNGIGVIDEYLSAYRYLSQNSWSLSLTRNTPEILDKKIKHYNNFISCLELTELDFPNLKNEINIKKKGLMIQLAKLYFLNKNKIEGENLIKKIKLLPCSLNLKEKIILILIKKPRLLKFISEIKIQ
ncbi:glycosyltransferase [Providencia rettgeri]